MSKKKNKWRKANEILPESAVYGKDLLPESIIVEAKLADGTVTSAWVSFYPFITEDDRIEVRHKWMDYENEILNVKKWRYLV